MPTSKSSTSSEPCDGRGEACIGCADCNGRGASIYKAMLDDLLSTIHRDGGQYTVLTGYAVSVEDAKKLHLEMRRQRNALQERIRHLVNE